MFGAIFLLLHWRDGKLPPYSRCPDLWRLYVQWSHYCYHHAQHVHNRYEIWCIHRYKSWFNVLEFWAMPIFFIVSEYTPSRWYPLHTATWVANLFGIFFILAAHEHYSIDVFVAFYISSRLFLYYHSLANTRFLNFSFNKLRKRNYSRMQYAVCSRLER